ncbi:sugar kinase [Rathayibacter soli]|uniref:sugar kinase n=1 Tax=Rathayibacter soli TaxID=3144168 RepID=UPI0027E42975|nr:sugar kinase [Glaciibacter superstes]
MPVQTIPRVITIGETMALVAPASAESLATAHELRLHAGGAESNVASHLAHVGIATAWVSALGDDVLGHRICRFVGGHGVDMRWVTFDRSAPTGVYFKDPGHGVLYYRRGSAASGMNADTVASIPVESAEVVHLSGITPALSESCAALVDAVFERVAGAGTVLSFDVNYRPALWADGAAAAPLLSLANRADLVFVGLDEAHALWGCDTADDVRGLLPHPDRLVVKDGSVGATEFADGSSVFAPAIPTDVVEAVGAGDAFAAGYLASLLRGEAAMDRLQSGHKRARLVLLSTSDFISESTAGEPTTGEPTTGKV